VCKFIGPDSVCLHLSHLSYMAKREGTEKSMITTEHIFFILLFPGILALLAGVGLTRFYWRPDIPPYGRHTRFLDMTLHPEKYAKDAPLIVIRTMNFAGVILLAGAVCISAYEILRTILRV
jgi:hypothetical protein